MLWCSCGEENLLARQWFVNESFYELVHSIIQSNWFRIIHYKMYLHKNEFKNPYPEIGSNQNAHGKVMEKPQSDNDSKASQNNKSNSLSPLFQVQQLEKY